MDYIKAVALLFFYCGFAPALGVITRNKISWQRWVFFGMCFMTIGGFLQAAEWGLTIHSILYRGTARGFHFFWAEVAAVALIVAKLTGGWRDFKFTPRGTFIYLLYCLASFISIINAPSTLYVWFAAVKAVKMWLIFVAAYNFLKTEEDMRFMLKCFSFTIMWELFAVLKLKYWDHVYQVYGTFEHQNSLSMFATMIGLVFLGVALGPKEPGANLFLFAYLCCAAIVQSTLSRGGLAVFAGGTIAIAALSIVEKPTRRRLAVLTGLSFIGIIGMALAMDTILGRFNDYGNEESKNTRAMLNISARMMVSEYPLGIGWNNFALTINHPYHYGDHIDHWQAMNGNPVDKTYKKGVVESLYYLVLSETGWQSLLLFLLFIGLSLWWSFRGMIAYRRQFLGAISMGLFIGLLSNYLQSFLERVLVQPRNMMLWFILLGATARIESMRHKAKKERRLTSSAQRPPNRRPAKPPVYREEEFAPA